MSQIVTGGLLAMGGAVASQATGFITLLNSGRRRQQDAATKRAVEREAKRRPLYEEALTTIDQARLSCAEVSEACTRLDPGDRALGRLAEGLAERLDPLRTVAVAVMIDGSARASETATAIAAAIREVTRAWKAAVRKSDAETLKLAVSCLSDLTDLLAKADRDLIAAARADFGVPD